PLSVREPWSTMLWTASVPVECVTVMPAPMETSSLAVGNRFTVPSDQLLASPQLPVAPPTQVTWLVGTTRLSSNSSESGRALGRRGGLVLVFPEEVLCRSQE